MSESTPVVGRLLARSSAVVRCSSSVICFGEPGPYPISYRAPWTWLTILQCDKVSHPDPGQQLVSNWNRGNKPFEQGEAKVGLEPCIGLGRVGISGVHRSQGETKQNESPNRTPASAAAAATAASRRTNGRPRVAE